MRITKKMLENKIAVINKMTNSPETSYTRNSEDKLTANIGNYHLSQAYGGYDVHRMMNESGGVTSLMSGHGTARECYTFLSGFIECLYRNCEK